MKTIFKWTSILILTSLLFLGGYYFRYRFIPLVKVGNATDIHYKNTEGYSDQLSYQLSDTVELKIRALSNGIGIVNRLLSNGEKLALDTFEIKMQDQPIDSTQSEFGCDWKTTNRFHLNESFQSGYYQIDLLDGSESSSINFIIEDHTPSKVIVLAPISTWVAYNDWGGKSFYNNNYEAKTVYFSSTQRPIKPENLIVEAQIANFFGTHYNAALAPDYYLENNLDELRKYDVIVLAYHAEYFTEQMYTNLRQLVNEDKKSLISLGGNQVYWKTKWNADYTILECHKDLTSFDDNILDYGGMWRHHLGKSEHHLLGVQYTESGIHTFAPYAVTAADHWMYNNLPVKNGTLFGSTGITNRGISGDETDKLVSLKSNMTVLAKGQNCAESLTGKALEDCIQQSGADFVITENEQNMILSTGSIESGAGLESDSVFTTMIHNFMNKVLNH
jgi:hypothetical protein